MRAPALAPSEPAQEARRAKEANATNEVAPASHPEDHILEALAWTVSVRTDESYGSGVVVAPGLALTAAHVVGEEDVVRARFRGEAWRETEVVARDDERDLALIEVGGDRDVAPLSQLREVRPGDPVLTLGSPKQMEFSVARGIVSYPGRQVREMRYLQTDLPANPGSSGGPVLDRSGELIGVMAFILPDSQGMAFVIPVGYAFAAFPEALADRARERDLDAFRAWTRARAP